MKYRKNSPVFWLMFILGAVALIGFSFTPAVADDGQGVLEEEQDEGAPVEIDDGGADADLGATGDGSFGERDQATWIGAMAFTPYDSSTAWAYHSPGMRAITGGSPWMDQMVRLPSGARLILARIFYHDISNGGRVWLWIWRNRYNVSPFTFTQIAFVQSPVGIANYTSSFTNMAETIQNGQHYYHVRFRSDNNNARFAGVRLFWHRQVRNGLPNPFNDIGGLSSGFQNAIKALAASGITGGCGGGSYCPNDPVTRGQMAVFLAKALGLYWAYPTY